MLAQAKIIQPLQPMRDILSERTRSNIKQAGALFAEFLQKHCGYSLPPIATDELREKICTVERFQQFAQFLYEYPKKDGETFYSYLSALQHLSGAKQAVEKIFGVRCVDRTDSKTCAEMKLKCTKFGFSEEAWYSKLRADLERQIILRCFSTGTKRFHSCLNICE